MKKLAFLYKATFIILFFPLSSAGYNQEKGSANEAVSDQQLPSNLILNACYFEYSGLKPIQVKMITTA